MRLSTRFGVLCFAVGTLLPSAALAQPLVDGNLTLYYDFNTISTDADGNKQFLDKSGNDFHGTIHEGDEQDSEPGTLTVDTEEKWRGAGAARFTQSPSGEDLPVYIDVHGEDITENHPTKLPTSGLNGLNGLAIAAWLNIPEEAAGDMSIFQARTSTGGHGAPHFQVQGSGQLRMTFRSQTGENVVNTKQNFDGNTFGNESYPRDEWFHYVGTYDADEGFWTMYVNGEWIAEDAASGFKLGDWGGQVEEKGDLFAAGIGAVYDSGGRRLNGLLDELYVFNRNLSEEEVKILATLPDEPVVIPGDCTMDGVVDAADLVCVSSVADRDIVLGTLNTLPGDLDGNGEIAFADFLILSANFNKDSQNYTQGNINVDGEGKVDFADFLLLSANFGKTAEGAASSVPEPNCFGLLACGMIAAGGLRRRRS